MPKSDIKIPIIIAIALLVLIGGYFYYAASTKKSAGSFHGPTSAPHVVGPHTLPPTN